MAWYIHTYSTSRSGVLYNTLIHLLLSLKHAKSDGVCVWYVQFGALYDCLVVSKIWCLSGGMGCSSRVIQRLFVIFVFSSVAKIHGLLVLRVDAAVSAEVAFLVLQFLMKKWSFPSHLWDKCLMQILVFSYHIDAASADVWWLFKLVWIPAGGLPFCLIWGKGWPGAMELSGLRSKAQKLFPRNNQVQGS